MVMRKKSLYRGMVLTTDSESSSGGNIDILVEAISLMTKKNTGTTNVEDIEAISDSEVATEEEDDTNILGSNVTVAGTKCWAVLDSETLSEIIDNVKMPCTI